ncbi:MAG: FAD-dependent oxidoreductase [Bacteroidota bacterium]|nr:FAD-dependent oxidoreductase [Bacteroidota bacterium]
MYKINKHPIIDVTEHATIEFSYNGEKVIGEKGFTIAAALHQAGYPVHSHSVKGRNRTLECGIGKCGACEMLVNGKVKRICVTLVDDVKEVREIPEDFYPTKTPIKKDKASKVYKTSVAIIGAGPAGLAAREVLNEHGVDNIVIDNNDKIGGQFLMQTHQFFFFEKEKRFGGQRGFDIANQLAGDNHDGIFLNSTIWDILQGKRLAVKNIKTEEVYYIDADSLIVATGAVPFMPAFENDDVPGVYTAAVVQKMMNTELTLLGKNILTIGAGNIGYLTSYQLMQGGANVKAILEAQPHEGGFPVQANRVRRLGIPIMTSYILLKAIPNKDYTGITGALIAKCENFKPIPGTEKIIDGIDAINICTGLTSDDELLTKGKNIFGQHCEGAGDAIRIGEGTSAVLRGQQAAYDILQTQKIRFNYHKYLDISKQYIESQQEPERIKETAALPEIKRMEEKPFVAIDCLYGFACNPCVFSCPQGAITKNTTSNIPVVDYDKCTGCMQCVYQCPGLAIFGYNPKKDWLFLPIEYAVNEQEEVYLVDNNGKILGNGIVEKILKKPNKTNIARVKSLDIHGTDITNARGFIIKESFPEEIELKEEKIEDGKTFICHCEDVTMDNVMDVIGDRKVISIDEIKHTTRLGMGACRGKRCVKRLRMELTAKGIKLSGNATPRAPLSNQIEMGEMYPKNKHEEITISYGSKKTKVEEVDVLIAGGGIGGSALFRYLAEAGRKPVIINSEYGGSWRNIAGGRPNFSLPELSNIAENNQRIFKELQEISNINYHDINYVTMAHDNDMYNALEKSIEWSDAYMIEPKDFRKEISPFFNPDLKKYQAALVTRNCWQATPGMVVDAIRQLGVDKGGISLEGHKLIDIEKKDDKYIAIVKKDNGEYIEYHANEFINAMGASGGDFAKKLGIETGIYPVKHQAFITRRLPMLGANNTPLPMVIDRRNYKGFTAVYGQQLAETGQIIGCASPANEHIETWQNMKVNSKEFLEIVSEIFVDWIPDLSATGFQAAWSGYYVEPKMIIDPAKGMFIGLRGQGFMLGQYLAKMYVDKMTGKPVPDYFDRLSLKGDGLLEKAFK